MAKRLGVWEIRKYDAGLGGPEQNISHWCYCFIWLINYVQTVALIKWMHSNQAMPPPPPLHPQLLDALSSVQQNFETQLKTRNRRYNDQCPVHNLSMSNFVERRWKLVPSIHLNAAVVARGILGSYFWLSMYWSSLVSIECCPYLHYWGCCHSRRPLQHEGPELNTPYLCRWGEYQYH